MLRPRIARKRERVTGQGLAAGQAAQPLSVWSTLPLEKAKGGRQRRPPEAGGKNVFFRLRMF